VGRLTISGNRYDSVLSASTASAQVAADQQPSGIAITVAPRFPQENQRNLTTAEADHAQGGEFTARAESEIRAAL
jgi:hypothetical protein